jgi:hypothetical protein
VRPVSECFDLTCKGWNYTIGESLSVQAVRPGPGADVGGVRPDPAQMWAGLALHRRESAFGGDRATAARVRPLAVVFRLSASEVGLSGRVSGTTLSGTFAKWDESKWDGAEPGRATASCACSCLRRSILSQRSPTDFGVWSFFRRLGPARCAPASTARPSAMGGAGGWKRRVAQCHGRLGTPPPHQPGLVLLGARAGGRVGCSLAPGLSGMS